jgi:hypothetical protein
LDQFLLSTRAYWAGEAAETLLLGSRRTLREEPMRFQLRHIVPLALLWMGCGAETPVSEALPSEAEELAQEQSMLQVSDNPSFL